MFLELWAKRAELVVFFIFSTTLLWSYTQPTRRVFFWSIQVSRFEFIVFFLSSGVVVVFLPGLVGFFVNFLFFIFAWWWWLTHFDVCAAEVIVVVPSIFFGVLSSAFAELMSYFKFNKHPKNVSHTLAKWSVDNNSGEERTRNFFKQCQKQRHTL